MAAPRAIFRRSRTSLYVAFFFSGCINVLMLATPLYTLQVFERVIPTASFDTLFFLSGILCAALLALALLEIARDRVLSRTGHRMDRDLSNFVLRRGLKVGARTTDVDAQVRAVTAIRNALNSSSINAVFDAPWVPLFCFVLFLLHFWLGIVTVIAAGLLVLVTLAQLIVAGASQRELGGAISKADTWRTAITANTRLTTALGLSNAACARSERLVSGRVFSSISMMERGAVVKSMGRLVRLGAQAAIFGVGAALVMLNEIGPGALIAASILMGRALAPLEQMVNSLRVVKSALGGVRLLKAVQTSDDRDQTGDPPGADGGADAEEASQRRAATNVTALTPGNLKLVGVTAYHPGRRMPAVRNITLEIPAGQLVAVIGPNGSGKSSLLALTAGGLAPAVGAVELDGVPVDVWQVEAERPRIGYLAEDPILFEGTAGENISRFRSATPLDVAEAAQAAGVSELLSGLANGIETLVGVDGRQISPRERRAVAFARALFGAPDVLVLDTPEAGLDRRADRRLAQSIEALKAAGSTILVATQRQDLMALADVIVVMNGGAIERAGPARQILEALGAAPPAQAQHKRAVSGAVGPQANEPASQTTAKATSQATAAPQQALDPRAAQARIAAELNARQAATDIRSRATSTGQNAGGDVIGASAPNQAAARERKAR